MQWYAVVRADSGEAVSFGTGQFDAAALAAPGLVVVALPHRPCLKCKNPTAGSPEHEPDAPRAGERWDPVTRAVIPAPAV